MKLKQIIGFSAVTGTVLVTSGLFLASGAVASSAPPETPISRPSLDSQSLEVGDRQIAQANEPADLFTGVELREDLGASQEELTATAEIQNRLVGLVDGTAIFSAHLDEEEHAPAVESAPAEQPAPIGEAAASVSIPEEVKPVDVGASTTVQP